MVYRTLVASMAPTRHCAASVAPMCLADRMKQRCRCRLSPLLMCAVLFAQLLLCSTSLPVAADPTIMPLLNITSTDKADPDEYYKILLSQDATILAGSTTALSSDGVAYPNLNTVKGLRSVFQVPGAPTVQRAPKRTSTALKAFRADVLSELLVAMALLYLDSTDALPFTRTAPIPSTYLPASYTGGASFVNPSFPTVPITLNMLLQHVSSLTKKGLDLRAETAPSGTVPTLSDFVSSLFSTAATTVFSASQPGLSTSYTYSHANVAIVAYVVEQVLATSTNYSALSGIGEFVFTVVMPPLQLSNTFLLNRNGHVIDATYPLRSGSSHYTVNYAARQVLDNRSTDILDSAPMDALYFSDYMLFTTGADVAKLVAEVLVPGGLYHTRLGASMLQNMVPIAVPTMRYTEARTTGLFLFSANKLCSTMYAAISYSGHAPYCRYSSATVSESAPPFGLVATSGTDELAIVCIPVVSNTKTFCSIAGLSFSGTGCSRCNAAAAGDRAVGLAMVSLAHLTSEPMPAPTSQSTAHTFNGWFVVLGVAVTLVVVVVASYITDYLIQPPPPAKIIAPVVASQMGLRSGTALNLPVGGDGAVGSSEVPVDSESPETFRKNGRDHDAEDRYSGADNEEQTPHLTRSGGPARGSSSLRRRRPRRRRHRDNGEQNPASDGSYSSADDGWGENLDSVDRASTGSQRPNPKGALRFDAYI
ncbi:hypothetical protein LMJF_12_0240 [Leishmania major strain Friedlin]|uniref:Beta-lactamase-related domain-containing protein n=1 Tax=Leishmania major TaxID=5664 RepID=Q4QGR9_LEIMA|nr:hypothetical protein LMJF_12_0240 [Leishmania major strain Friedlin]CAG9570430.1 hypothetical_protein_-_conserved [Leishmania major strain Friedlin]CAJ02478.1 hypothetical protein LMJF_12_0240 [Leishmania major strain Friedlin]|eukprot:XP_001681629.1 hypothetical protein LMJF_12_0240 [Leishmania major strain Friedlin]